MQFDSEMFSERFTFFSSTSGVHIKNEMELWNICMSPSQQDQIFFKYHVRYPSAFAVGEIVLATSPI
jgi:hypothetical protein